MSVKKKRLTIDAIKSITKSSVLQDEKVKSDNNNESPKKVKLKDLEKFSKSVRFPVFWKNEIENNIDYPTDLSSFIVEAIKEKMEREEMNTFLG
jgi:hypothetical protein